MAERKRHYPPIYGWLYDPLVSLVRVLAKVLTRYHVEGLEHVPRQGALMIVSNHLHHLDTVMIAVAMPRRAWVLAAEKYEKHLLFGPILRVGGAIFIRRGEVDRKALRAALEVLEDGHCLALAVEGTRSRTGALAEGKAGAAYLATRADVPLVPVVVWGTEKVIPSWFRLRRADVYVRFGKPFRLPAGRARPEELDTYTEEIMTTLAAMLPPEYRGVYRDHPLLKRKLADSAP